jgi:hypothetical protein
MLGHFWTDGEAMLESIPLFVALLTGFPGQLVQVAPVNPNYCNQIPVKPNLVVTREAEIFGDLSDQTGAPFANTKIELRAWRSPTVQVHRLTVRTNKLGQWGLGRVPPGKYRLIASPTRAFAQPELIEAGASWELNVELVLHANPTDMPDSQCAVR